MKLVLILFSSIIVVILVWHLLTKKYLNPYTLTIIFGKKGCGKSTLLQKLAVHYRKKGYHVYCNIGDSDIKECTQIPIQDLPILAEAGHNIEHYNDKSLYDEYVKQYLSKTKKNNRNTIITNTNTNTNTSTNTNTRYMGGTDSTDKLKILTESRGGVPKSEVPLPLKSPAVILCDEINLLWDNRNFKNFSPELQKYFRLQRHYHHIFIGFSQTYDCDKKIRDLADYLLICKRVARVWIRTKAYVKKVVVVSPDNTNSRDTATMTDDFVPLGIFNDLFTVYQAWLPKWVKYHDSFK